MSLVTNSQSTCREPLRYVVAVALCLFVLSWTLKLWKADFRVPFAYSGDGLSYQMLVKSAMDDRWYLHNHFLAYPGLMEMEDYPMADGLNFLLIKGLSTLTRHSGKVSNLYFLLTFPLTTLVALFVLRRFGVNYLPSLAASLLFTFTPYHFFRGEIHLFLAAYYLVPLIVLIALQICQGWNPWSLRTEGKNVRARWIEFFIAIGICALMAASGVYYAFFSCFVLFVAGVWAAIQQRSVRPLFPCGAFLAIISIVGLAQFSPTILHHLRHGDNPDAVARSLDDAEIFALKVETCFCRCLATVCKI